MPWLWRSSWVVEIERDSERTEGKIENSLFKRFSPCFSFLLPDHLRDRSIVGAFYWRHYISCTIHICVGLFKTRFCTSHIYMFQRSLPSICLSSQENQLSQILFCHFDPKKILGIIYNKVIMKIYLYCNTVDPHWIEIHIENLTSQMDMLLKQACDFSVLRGHILMLYCIIKNYYTSI